MAMSLPPWVPEDIPLDRPSAARMYDYYLGGYHNFAIDREAAQRAVDLYPDFPLVMRANRAFLRRAVQFLGTVGIAQFLDIGSGIPTVGNVHEVAREVVPGSRVVYVDNDPVAVAHSRAILHDDPLTAVLGADAREPERILAHPEVRRLLDFREPLAVLVVFLLHFITRDEEAYRLVRTLRDALPPGSYLIISHGTYGIPPELRRQLEELYAHTPYPVRMRSHAEIAQFFAGFELVEPGLVYPSLWRPDDPDELFADQPERCISFAGVGRKP